MRVFHAVTPGQLTCHPLCSSVITYSHVPAAPALHGTESPFQAILERPAMRCSFCHGLRSCYRCVELNQACRLQTPSAWMVLHRGSLNAQQNQSDVPDKVPDSSPPMAPAMASHSRSKALGLTHAVFELQTAKTIADCAATAAPLPTTSHYSGQPALKPNPVPNPGPLLHS